VEGRDAPCGGSHGGERRLGGSREAEEGALPGRGGVCGVASPIRARAPRVGARSQPETDGTGSGSWLARCGGRTG
jgi:hypothetical protein